MNIKLPNFLVVGSTKSGTTSLYYYLKQHPEIYLNEKIKETNFFIEPKDILGNGPRYFGKDSFGTSIQKYSELFSDVDIENQKAIGEICTTYLHFSDYAIPNIKKYLKNPKIIIILRNPVERAFSHYMHNVRDGDENLSFKAALEAEDQRKKKNLWISFRYKELGNYYYHVKNYFDNFTNVKVLFYDNMKKDINLFLEEIYNFLDVSNITVYTDDIYNFSGKPKNRIIHNILHDNKLIFNIMNKGLNIIIGKRNFERLTLFIDKKNLKRKSIEKDLKVYLESYYYEDVRKLSSLLNKDMIKEWKILEYKDE